MENSLKAEFWYSAMEGKNCQIQHWILPGEEAVIWIISPSHVSATLKWIWGSRSRERELKQEQGVCDQACIGGVMEQLMKKACSGGKKPKKPTYSVFLNVRIKSLPRTWPGLKRRWGFADFTAELPHFSALTTRFCKGQEDRGAPNETGSERTRLLVTVRHSTTAPAQESWWSWSGGSTAGTSGKAPWHWSCFLFAVLWASASSHGQEQDPGLDQPLFWPQREALVCLCLTKKYRCAVLISE